MLTHPTITTSPVGVDSWRQNVFIAIVRWTLVRIIEEEAGHHARVSVRVGQHKSDSHLHETLHPQDLLFRRLIDCFMTHRLVAQIRYKDISFGICDRQSGIGAGLAAITAVVSRLYHVTAILYHLYCTFVAIDLMTAIKILSLSFSLCLSISLSQKPYQLPLHSHPVPFSTVSH